MDIVNNKWHDPQIGYVQESVVCQNNSQVTHKGDWLACKHCHIEYLQKQVERVRNVRVIDMVCGDEAVAQVVDYAELMEALNKEEGGK